MRSVHPVAQWLSIRVRLLCVLMFCISAILPPYVPREALAQPLDFDSPTAPQYLLVEEGFLMKSSSLTKQGSRRAYAQGIIHTVAQGDTFQKLSQRFGISVDTIRFANKLEPGVPLQPGQDLLILPVDGVVHTVTKGQNLTRIGELYGIAPENIALQNNIASSYILPGQELIIPGGKPIVQKPAVAAVPSAPSKTPGKTPSTPAAEVKKPAVEAKVNPTAGAMQMPCNNCYYTQYYNPGHEAVDIQTKGGGPIFASEAGTVIRADYGWNGGYGNVIEVDHGNGVVTLYGHNKELYVKVGDSVERGQQMAWMGRTGRVYGATGIHIHFEVRVNGVKKNPLLYLQ